MVPFCNDDCSPDDAPAVRRQRRRSSVGSRSRRPSVVRRSAGLADAVASADSTLAKLEAFLSRDDSQANLLIDDGGNDTCSLQSDLSRVRDGEDAMRRELEGLWIMSDGSSSSLGSWKMAGDEASHDEKASMKNAKIAAAAGGLSVIRGQWTSALDLAGLDKLKVELEDELEQSHSSDASLGVEDIFEIDAAAHCIEEPSLFSSDCNDEGEREDRGAEGADSLGSLCYSPSPTKTPRPIGKLGETELSTPSASSSSECSFSADSIASPVGTDISFDSSPSSDECRSPCRAGPSMSTSMTCQVERTEAKEGQEEQRMFHNFDEEIPFVNEELLTACHPQTPSEAPALRSGERLFTSEGTCRATTTQNEAGCVKRSHPRRKEKNTNTLATVLRWAERLAEFLYGQ